MCTIKDFYNFTKKRNIKISQSLAVHNERATTIKELNRGIKNLTAELGIFLIEKNEN
ncbi:methionine biosynthesis protein MetW [Candidatus Pelagibacter sp.]|nr:methionine biosynthesis protein MetW [Candidatus Pelagibacter sp.]